MYGNPERLPPFVLSVAKRRTPFILSVAKRSRRTHFPMGRGASSRDCPEVRYGCPRPFRVLLCALALAFAAAPARAAAPDDTFVMAKDMADVATLDPAEAFEFTTGELVANLYDRILMFEPENPDVLVGGVAESHAVSEDGKELTFRIRRGLRFHSGNPVRPEDVEFSLERVVKLDKTPAFLLTQFGWNADNVEDRVEVVDPRSVRLTIVEDFSPGLVMNVLSAGVGSVVDEQLVLAHEKDGDLGHGWLKSHSAGSGPFRLESWTADESVVLEANPDYRRGPPGMKRVVLRHAPDPAAQRRMLEQGDIDLARNLDSEQVKALRGRPDVVIDDRPTGTIVYLAANASHPILGKAKVVQALRHAVDYQGMAESFLAGQFTVHQAFWPRGLWASYTETPYRLDVEKARSLLAEAGHGDGFEVRIDTLTTPPFPRIARSVQTTLARVGVKTRIAAREGKVLWPRYRGRKHELILAHWSPDYPDPHSNADAFAHNPDNRPEAGLTGVLAWRNAWAQDDLNAMVVRARDEPDPATRRRLYLRLQERLQTEGPYVVMFQQIEQVARRGNVRGFAAGSNFDQVHYRNVTK